MASDTIWTTLEHPGPIFAPGYIKCPETVSFYYEGKKFPLSHGTEEVASFYAKLNNDFPSNVDEFKRNFFQDWRQIMDSSERKKIKELSKCNFSELAEYFNSLKKQEKLQNKKKQTENHSFCIVDGKKEQVYSYEIPGPGIFIGPGEHPKNGKLKKRLCREDIIVNIGKEAKTNIQPFNWKSIVHDRTKPWLAKWTNNVTGESNYIRVHESSQLAQKAVQRTFEIARKLRSETAKIEQDCLECCQSSKSSDVEKQRAVAVYLINKLFIRVGDEKSRDTADTVGCCTLRVEHITLDEVNSSVELNFFSQESILFIKSLRVHENVFKVLRKLLKKKKSHELLFDKVDSYKIDEYLRKFNPNFSAKLFRTFGASNKYQEKLHQSSRDAMTHDELLSTQRQALLAASELLNHKRCKEKLDNESTDDSESIFLPKNTLSNYIDPRITVAWCNKFNIPLEQIFIKAEKEQFVWAISENSDFVF